ncbi:MAG: Uma2 family endonuclease [Sarcina sp.]
MSNLDRDYELEFLVDGNLEAYKNLEKTHNGKVEYANGTILLSSSTSINHNLIIKRLLIETDRYFRKIPCETFSEAIEVIMDQSNKKYNFKPDVFVMCKDSNEEDFNRKGQSLVGIPSLIFEVVSQGNANHDTLYKRKAYAECGVKEYCLVYQDGKIEQLELKANEYYEINAIYNVKDIYKSLVYEELAFNLEDIFYDLQY